MRIIRPGFILHQLEDKKRPCTLFTLSIHPDASRLATGGLDTKIKIWSTHTILDETLESNLNVPKLLCTMTSHSGVVMCVRWSTRGKYLASGSDDNIVMVWALDSGAGGKVWGSTETNVENWKAVKRLVGHASDVAGVAWNADDSYLASVGLDSTVLIWSGTTFECLQKLTGHQGFVKGVVWDPVGQYLATQSDDNSVKIWRTSDWGMQQSIEAPFKNSPCTTFTRLSWSPDGAHLVTPNSMNGPVFVASVIDRATWESNHSMVGHENVVEVAIFNPKLFLRDPKGGTDGANLCTLLAIAARNSISLWITSQSQPLVVLDEVFDRDVLDMSWSSDGLSLWSCSSDGQVAVFTFDPTELNTVAPPGTQQAYFRAAYNHQPAARPLAAAASFSSLSTTTFSQAKNGPAAGTLSKPNMLAPRKGPGAKRAVLKSVAPPAASTSASAFVNPPSLPMPSTSSSALATSSQLLHLQQQQYLQQQQQLLLMQQQQQQAFANSGVTNSTAFPTYPYASTSTHQPSQLGAGPSFGGNATSSSLKRKASPPAEYTSLEPTARISDAPYRTQGRTLGETRMKENDPVELNVVRPAYIPETRLERFRVTNSEERGPGASVQGKVMAVPDVMSLGSIKIEDEEGDVLEWRNFAEGDRKGTSEIGVMSGEKSLWLDYLPRFVVCAAGSARFVAVSTEDGALNVYSPTGRRLLPTLILDSPCSLVVAEGSYLMTITALGSLSVWNTALQQSLFPPLNLSTLLLSSTSAHHPTPTITTSSILPNGAPVIALSSGATYSYDGKLNAWIRLSDTWWSKGSEFWEGRRGKASTTGRGLVRVIESAINDIVVHDESVELSEDEETEEEKEEEEKKEGDDSSVLSDPEDDANGNGKGKEKETDSRPTKRRKKMTVPIGKKEARKGDADDFTLAMSLGHLEERMAAAKMVESSGEYKFALGVYAKKVAEEGLRSKGEELVRELMGPIYFKPSKEETWTPTILGFNKRDLLKDVLNIFAKSKALNKLGTENQELLKKLMAS